MNKTRKFKRTRLAILIMLAIAAFVVATLFVTSGCTSGEDGNCCTTAHHNHAVHSCYDCDDIIESGKYGLCGEAVCVCRQTIVDNCENCDDNHSHAHNGKYGLCGQNPCVCRQTIYCCR